MPRKFYLLLPIFFLFARSATRAQELIFENLSGRIAIPSSECYNVTQDRDGYLWIATEQGLVRYDGTASRLFGASSGLAEKAVYAMAQGPDGKLWLATSAGRILYFSDGKLHGIAAAKSFKDLMAVEHQLIFNLSVSASKIYINTSRNLFEMDLEGSYTRGVVAGPATGIVMLRENGRLVFVQLRDRANSASTPVVIRQGGRVERFGLARKRENAPHWRVLTAKIGENSFFSANYQLVRLGPDLKRQVYGLPAAIISMYADQGGGLWVGTLKKGVFYFPDPAVLSRPIVSLANLSVSGICQDREKNIWCTTLEDGVFLSRSSAVRSYAGVSGLSMPVNMLKVVGGRLFVSPVGGGLRVRQGGVFKNPVPQIVRPVYNIFSQYNSTYFITQSESAVIVDSTFARPISPKWRYSDQLMPSLTIYGNNTIERGRTTYTISYDKIFRHSPSGIEVFQLIRSTGKCIEYLDDGHLLYGCANGLYRLDIRTRESEKFAGIHQTVTKIFRDGKGGIWICTKGDGLYVMQQGKPERLDQRLNLSTDIFYDIAQDGRGRLWAGTNKGIIVVDDKKGGFGAKLYSTLHGLPSDEIGRVAVYGKELFFSTPKGLASIPLDLQLDNTSAPQVSLERIEVNDKQVALAGFGKRGTFSPRENSFRFTFSVRSYKNDGHLLFYRIQQGGKYMPVQGNRIILQNLRADSYQLSVYGQNSDGVKSLPVAVIGFTVDSPFWQKGWFVCVMVFVLGAIGYLLRRLQQARAGKREQERSRIRVLVAQSRLSALQARMNPHFIFNAINSIQNYIFKSEHEKAQGYLSKFSRLIRLVLQQSGERSLSLAEELDTLSLYIELEKLRFKTAFDYQINLSEGMEPAQVHIPAMLVQPYVENAIWHGLMNLGRSREGKLLVDISGMGRELLIVVEDNGVGRKRAGELKAQSGYVSSGMLLTEQRLDMLREIYAGGSFSVRTIDLFDGEIPTGTRVEITLSLDYDYTQEYE